MKSLDNRSKYLRSLIINTVLDKGGGHIGSALSLVEILRVLYDDILNFKIRKKIFSNRDRLILSKGHGCLALYTILADKKFLKKSDLQKIGDHKFFLAGHPERNLKYGIEASTGSLGHGFSIAIGIAIAAKIKKKNFKTFVIVGDGELNEGSNWEAMLTANKYKLDNLCLIIDYNKLQSYGKVDQVLNLNPLREKIKSFGFQTYSIDGHDIKILKKTFNNFKKKKTNKPTAIICNTIKGKGVLEAESNPVWHYKSKLNKNDIEILKKYIN